MENVVNSATHENQTHSVPCAVTTARIINESKAVNSPCGRSSPSAASTLVYSTIPTTSTVYQFAHSGTSTLTFRLAASGPIHDTVSSSTAMSSSCSLIFDATMLETHGTSSVQRQVNFTSASTPVSVGPACLVMSSDGSSAQRVLIQKATGTLQPLRSTVSSDPFTVLGAVDVSSSGATTFLHAVKPATSSSHPSAPLTLHSPKTKLVNLTPPTSTGVRLLASATPKAATSSTPPATFHVSPSLVVQSGISPLKAGSIPTPLMGLAPPNKLGPTAPSSVTVHHPQPLLVRTSSDCTIGITRDQSIYPASSVPSTVSPQLYASTPTVLAFSLTPGMPSTTNISNPNVIAQVNPSTKANVQVSVNSPLVIRASYTPSSPSSSAQPLSAASLLKPFSLSIPTTTQTISSSTPAHPVLGQTSVQHVIPVNITPAKLSPFQPPVSTVSLVRHHSAVPISPRHVPASVVAQANRRRARKQQLATGSGETSPTNQPASTAVGVEGSRPVSQTTIAMSVATLAEGQPAQTTTVVPSASSVKTTWTHSIPDCPASTDNLTNSNVLGIRLVSVRPNNASSNTPNRPDVDYSMSTPVTIQEAPINLLGTLSPLVSTGFARPATSTLEQPCSQTSAVYVLTSSSCPVVNTTPSSEISSVTLPAPTFHTPASLIPCCGNLVQFRLQSPILTTGTSYKASEPLSVDPSVRLNDATVSATSGNLHPPSLNCFVTEAISKPRTTSQVSPCESTQPYNNSLPHRGPHLSSPNNSHGNYMNVEISRPTLIATDPQDVRPTRGPLTRDIDSTWVFRRTRLPSDVTNPSDDASSENLTLPPHSTKRLKIHNEAYPSSQSSGPENTPSANEKCSIMSHDSQGLLSTLPSRPSMMPHPPSTRSTGALVRSKSSHFLSLADIRHKPASRFDRPRDTLSGHAPGSALAVTERSKLAKRRRRANARRVADSQPPSATDASPSSPRDLSASERRLLHDLASLLLRQKEMKFVNFPLTVASVISLTGWRTLSCVNNLDLLLSTERDTLRSFEAVIPDLNALLQSGPSNPSVRLDAPLSTQPTSISSTNSSDRPGTPERLSTASVLTSFSALATSSDLHPDVHSELEKALELIKGITQRKNSLISSIDHLRSLTTNVLEHFRSSIASHIGEFEQAYGTAADSVPSSSRTAARSNEDEQSLKRSRGRSSEAMPEKQQETEVNACNGFMDGGSVRRSYIQPGNKSLMCWVSRTTFIDHSDESSRDLYRTELSKSNLSTNLDDLESLQSTLEKVQSHLSQLQHGTEYDDLVALRDQLRELISIKQQDAPIHGLPQSDQPSQFDTNLRDSLIGQRCSLPGWLANGKYVQQSVVICDVVEPGDHDSIGRVRVLFAHPTRISDVPCAELLNHGSCPRGLRCPNSHGSIVSVEELIDWNAPDQEIVTKEGQPCLVKDPKSTGLWHYAHILHTDAESGMCVVELGSKNSSGSKRRTYHRLEDSVLNVPLESVHILTQYEAELYENETSDVVEDDDSSGDEVYVSYSKTSITPGSSRAEDILPHKPRKRIQFVPGGILMPEDILRPVQVKDPVNLVSVESAEPLGAWEAHTRGIGSRLLAKVGYDATHGLGHSGQGRRLPVALILDKFQIRPSKWNKRPCLDRVVTSHMDESSEGKKRTSTRDKINSGDLGVFRTINAALGRAREEPMPEPVVESAKVQQFKLHEEIQNVSREIQRAEQSYKRNVGRDRVIAKQVQDRLSTLQNRLAQLQNKERTLKQKTEQTQHSGKKLRIF